MAKKKSEKTAGRKPKKSGRAPIILMGTVLFIALAAGGWYTYATYFKSDYPQKALAYVDLDDAVLRFTWMQIPDIYGHMVRANSELTLMESEINRIKGVKKKYPRQNKIASSEIKRWEKSAKRLSGQIGRFQGQVEALYVTFRVNPEKGRTAVHEKRTDLASSLRDVLADLEIKTAPLRAARVLPKGVPGVIERVKRRFL